MKTSLPIATAVLFLSLSTFANYVWSIDPSHFPEASATTDAIQIWSDGYDFDGQQGCFDEEPHIDPKIGDTITVPPKTPSDIVIVPSDLPDNRRQLRQERDLNVFTPDERVFSINDTYPERTAGRFDGTSWYCTATLIGPNVILTNAHCVVEGSEPGEPRLMPDLQGLRDFRFYPALKNGIAVDSAKAIAVVIDGAYLEAASGFPEDWAVVMLDQNLGHKYGWVAMEPTIASNLSIEGLNPVSLTGYSSDRCSQTACSHHQCALRAAANFGSYQDFVHDCDSTSGSSGSSILNSNHTLVALHHAHFSCDGCVEPYRFGIGNLALPTTNFMNFLMLNAADYSQLSETPAPFEPGCFTSHNTDDDTTTTTTDDTTTTTTDDTTTTTTTTDYGGDYVSGATTLKSTSALIFGAAAAVMGGILAQ